MLSVKAVAHTQIDYQALAEAGYIDHWTVNEPTEPDSVIVTGDAVVDGWIDVAPNPAWNGWVKEHIPTEIDELHEAAGRGCYQSWSRPNPKTATNKGYLGNIIDVQHESVLGHGHVTFYVAGVSRALLLELERHAEHMNINLSVVSQRYVDHSEAEFVIPPLLEKHLDERVEILREGDWAPTVRQALDDHHRAGQYLYEGLAEFMDFKGYKRKEIRGAARAVLPENTETKFFVTGSIRAWRDIIRKRATDGADIEIRLFAIEVLRELIRLAPNSVQDFAEQYANDLGENQ